MNTATANEIEITAREKSDANDAIERLQDQAQEAIYLGRKWFEKLARRYITHAELMLICDAVAACQREEHARHHAIVAAYDRQWRAAVYPR